MIDKIHQTPIFTVGYGNRKLQILIDLLKKYRITTLVDIRTNPFSRFQPHYNKLRFGEILKEQGINYLFLGQELGGKPKDAKYYIHGILDYQIVNNAPEYKEAIQGLINRSEEGEILCLMCCELKPDECHRKTLVGETLYVKEILIKHINEHGELVDHRSSETLF